MISNIIRVALINSIRATGAKYLKRKASVQWALIRATVLITKALYRLLVGCVRETLGGSVGPSVYPCFFRTSYHVKTAKGVAGIPTALLPFSCSPCSSRRLRTCWAGLHHPQSWPTAVSSPSRSDLKQKKIPTLKFSLKSNLSPAVPAGPTLPTFASQSPPALITHSLARPHSPFLSFLVFLFSPSAQLMSGSVGDIIVSSDWFSLRGV